MNRKFVVFLLAIAIFFSTFVKGNQYNRTKFVVVFVYEKRKKKKRKRSKFECFVWSAMGLTTFAALFIRYLSFLPLSTRRLALQHTILYCKILVSFLYVCEQACYCCIYILLLSLEPTQGPRKNW